VKVWRNKESGLLSLPSRKFIPRHKETLKISRTLNYNPCLPVRPAFSLRGSFLFPLMSYLQWSQLYEQSEDA